MTHRADQIIDRFVTLLPDVAQSIFKHRRRSLSETSQKVPAISVDVGEDSPLDDDGSSNLAFLDSLLTVEVTALARGANEPELVAQLLEMRADIHRALMADRALGLSFVIDTRYGGASDAEIDGSASRLSGRLTSRWLVHYRMNVTDPE